MESNQERGIKAIISRRYSAFRKLFWVTILMEFFERGAYYAVYGVLAVHLAYNLDLPNLQVGILNALLYLLLYAVPLVSGALAERIGYKRSLRFAFSMMMVGYFLLGLVSILLMNVWSLGTWSTFFVMVFIFLFLGIGAGTFKPIVSATIGKTSSEENRNLAYMTFYWFINLGAFIFPLIFGLVYLIMGMYVKNEEPYYVYIFFLGAFFILVNYMINKLKYENPEPPNKEKKVWTSVKNIVLVVKDTRMLLLILIYSGFFIIFGLMHVSIPLYMVDFKIMPAWFSVLFLSCINPFTIITIGPLLSGLAKKFQSLQLMIGGILIFVFGMFIMGYTTIWFFFILGIVIFSCGEFIGHPNYQSYVSKIAPKEKLALYMGASFIPSAIGVITGSVLGHGVVYERFAAQMERPKLFWGIMGAIGVLTVCGLLWYNQKYGKGSMDKTISQKKTFLTKATDSKFTILVVLLIIPLLIGLGYWGGSNTYYREETGEEDLSSYLQGLELIGGADSDTNTIPENSQQEGTMDIRESNVLSINFTLSWTDEPDHTQGFRTFTNQPDYLGLIVEAPNGEVQDIGPVANSLGQGMSVNLEFRFDTSDKGEWLVGTGQYNFTVVCGECGDQEPPVNIIGLRTIPDTENTWTLDVDYYHYREIEEE